MMKNAVYYLATIINGNDIAIPKAGAGSGQLSAVMNTIVFPLAGVVCVIFLILGALKYVTSQGEANGVKQAKEAIIYSLVGLVIVAMSFTILQIIIKIGQG